MVDIDVILAKSATVRKHLERIRLKCGNDLEAFLKDEDRQDIVAFNMYNAIQNCIDIAAHIVSYEGLGVPGSVNEMFYALEEKAYITRETTEKMVKAVGFRNLLVHEYGKMELTRVFKIARTDMNDLMNFVKEVFDKLGLKS